MMLIPCETGLLFYHEPPVVLLAQFIVQ